MEYELEQGSHSVFLLTYHIVWCVKYRRTVLTHRVGDRLKEILAALIADAGGTVLALETQVDHVHIVLRATPKHQLAKLVNSLKGVSARRLFQEFPILKRRWWKGHLWSPSYLAVTVGGGPREIIKRYVETQRER